MHYRKFLLYTTILSTLLLSNCTNEYLEDINPICFEQDVLPIFVSNCTMSGCHNSQDKTNGYEFTSYETITAKGITPGDYKNSKVYEVLVSAFTTMPPSPYERLSTNKITTIAQWIELGAKNDTCTTTTTCDTTGVTFSQSVLPIFDAYCNGCHSGASPSGEINLTSYAQVVTVNTDRLLGSINHASNYSPMPQNTDKLSDCNIALIAKWIADGSPNN